jgi:diaminopimelate epimerase
MKIEFIKGHMGGNTIVVLDGRDIPEGQELDITLDIMRSEKLCAQEAGLLYPSTNEYEDLRVRIVAHDSRKFISACGGLTQVLGQVLAQTRWGERFGIDMEKQNTIRLGTEAGIFPIQILKENNKIKIITNMTSFLKEIYEMGIEHLVLYDTKVWRIGKFLVINADELRKVLPDANVESLDEATRKQIVKVQSAFFEKFPFAGFDVALYDNHPLREGYHFRVTFPHSIPKGFIEPSCGTGSIALCIAAFLDGYLSYQNEKPFVTVKLESGGGPELGGPDTTEVFLRIDDNKVKEVYFTHNNVEITCEGSVFV